jgi:hypothetical protein
LTLGPAGGDDVHDGKRYGGRLSLLWSRPTQDHAARGLPEGQTDGFNREEFYNLYDNQFTSPSDPEVRQAHQYLKLRGV